MRRSDLYQLLLIVLGAVAVVMFGVFLHRELFPEYRIYQNDYVALEKFRSTYTGVPPPAFSEGVKQIVIEREDRGPPTIDRCISCHVALQFSHFSPTKIAHDINGNVQLDINGNPLQVPNEEYVWAKLDQKIADLTDSKVIEQLRVKGETGQIANRLQEAKSLEQLKTAQVDGHIYDVTKVLTMHPLIGKETRPFEFHPLEEFGCVSCHNGNGRGLTTEKAHGPVFDGQYEIEYMGPTPVFLESDPKNDPQFSRMFNSKPGPELLFQTTPIFIGALIQSKCVQCHQTSGDALQESLQTTSQVTEHFEQHADAIHKAYEEEKQSLITALTIKQSITQNGLAATVAALQKKLQDYTLTPSEADQTASQLNFISRATSDQALEKINKLLDGMLGSKALSDQLEATIAKSKSPQDLSATVDKFLTDHQQDPHATGTLFAKAIAWNAANQIEQHVQDTETSLEKTVSNQQFVNDVSSDIDSLTKNFHRGQHLYLSQACYACHRIAAFSRGGVGPELTHIGNNYPWYIKESIVWPQADLPSSTMPNERLDHDELEDLMTFLLAQKGDTKAIASIAYRDAVQEWEAGKKKPWELPITPAQMQDLRFAMTVFATEGCAACHRLKGYESNVGYSVEKNKKPDFAILYKEKQWFTNLFPETAQGSEIVAAIDKHHDEIDQRIIDNVRQGSILEQIEQTHPGDIKALYSPFEYAMRAKNDYYAQQIAATSDEHKKAQLESDLQQWQERVRRIRMVYIQEYGLGRLICPRPNWSGVYRSDEWLMEHFHNPSAHVARSLMPVFPFDDTKFYALTRMLDTLGIRNRDAEREIWQNEGFSAELLFKTNCAQCHGTFREGNGPVAEWIYPIPKNLHNADFLRNLTKERAIQSITHGVKGTPMPPWGEVATDKPTADGIPVLTSGEIQQLVDWLFSSVPGAQVIKSSKDVPKWQYEPQDILKELHDEGNTLQPAPEEGKSPLSKLPKGNMYYASLDPVASAENPPSVSDIFDVAPNPIPGPDKNVYYIKRKFYTEENIEQGKAFFELNCAVCHGKEADGSGIRSEQMFDAKPRNFLNLDWLESRDDLRLLRSIKYGVPGTAMTPWGDFTSSLQRMQLVIFIRSLSQDRQRREELASSIYKSFNTAMLLIENARIGEYEHLAKIQSELEKVQAQEESTTNQVQKGKLAPDQAIAIYQNKLSLLKQLNQQTEIDKLFTDLKGLVKQESDIYQSLGQTLLTKVDDDHFLQLYRQLILLNEGRYTLTDGKLSLHHDPKSEKEMTDISQQLMAFLSQQITESETEKTRIEGQFSSAKRTEELARLNALILALNKLKHQLGGDLEEAARLRKNQAEVFQQLQEKLKVQATK